jgi:ribonucleotide reductase beta subunit family protein with ferritin-like domain
MAATQQMDIFKEFGNKYVLFPIKYGSVWALYKKALSAFWTTEEIDLSKDAADWERLSEGERHFVENVLAFFAGSDGIVNENLAQRFLNEIPVQEVKSFYGFQIAMENIHCVTGSTRILTRKGYVPIQVLEGKMADVWNGHEWSDNVTVFKTSDDAPVMSVTLSNGMFLECTPNHEWVVLKGEKEQRVHAADLAVGDEIAPFTYPESAIAVDELILSNAREHGRRVFSNPALDAAPYNPIRYNCRTRDFVPLNYSKQTQIEWFRGALENAKTDGAIGMLYHPDSEVLVQVQLMLTLLNVPSNHGEDMLTFMPADLAAGTGIIEAQAPGPRHKPEPEPKLTVAYINRTEQRGPVYCFEEPKRHTGVFNGICTGQSETYSLLLDTYIKDAETKARLLNAIETVPAIKKKAEWSLKWISNQEASFAHRLVAFACVEGIFFSGAFCAIFWLKERGVMPGLTFSNELISRDESLHTEFAVHLYGLIQAPLSQDTIHEIVRECVEIEDEFINESIPCNLLGMNSELMSQYIRFVADRLVVQLGAEPIYGVGNPFDFMGRISLSNKSNFFEHTRVAEYAKARVGGDEQANTFALDEDF